MYKIITSTGAEPVLLADAKLWLKLDSDITEDDTIITDLIISGRMYCENYTGVGLVAHNMQARFNEVVNNEMPLKFRATTINSITKYYQGSSSVVSTDIYELDTFNNRIILKYNQKWGEYDYFIVDYDSANDSNEVFERCIKNYVADEYMYRQNPTLKNRAKINIALDQYRKWEFR